MYYSANEVAYNTPAEGFPAASYTLFFQGIPIGRYITIQHESAEAGMLQANEIDVHVLSELQYGKTCDGENCFFSKRNVQCCSRSLPINIMIWYQDCIHFQI